MSASNDAPINVLFLCTGNSARSVLSEGYLTSVGAPRFRGFSAGSRPTGTPNPYALQALVARGIDASGFRSKSWDEFARPDAPEMHIIITVCDNAAGETCPIWPGRPASGHWGLPDPAAISGTPEEIRAGFESVFATIRRLIDELVETSAADLTPDQIRPRLQAIANRHISPA